MLLTGPIEMDVSTIDMSKILDYGKPPKMSPGGEEFVEDDDDDEEESSEAVDPDVQDLEGTGAMPSPKSRKSPKAGGRHVAIQMARPEPIVYSTKVALHPNSQPVRRIDPRTGKTKIGTKSRKARTPAAHYQNLLAEKMASGQTYTTY